MMSSHLCLDLPKCLFTVGLSLNILKALLLFSILATYFVHLDLFQIVESSPPFPIFIFHGARYLPQGPVLKYNLHSFLNV